MTGVGKIEWDQQNIEYYRFFYVCVNFDRAYIGAYFANSHAL